MHEYNSELTIALYLYLKLAIKLIRQRVNSCHIIFFIELAKSYIEKKETG